MRFTKNGTDKDFHAVLVFVKVINVQRESGQLEKGQAGSGQRESVHLEKGHREKGQAGSGQLEKGHREKGHLDARDIHVINY